MENELQITLNNILNDKNTNLKPENLKTGITCLGVEGTMESGLDTSDATATVNDLAEGKTAYVNGVKIEGTLQDHRNGDNVGINTVQKIDVNVADTKMIIYTKQFASIVADPTTNFNVNMNMSQMAEAIGLTADKIKAGEVILGITGTYEGV